MTYIHIHKLYYNPLFCMLWTYQYNYAKINFTRTEEFITFPVFCKFSWAVISTKLRIRTVAFTYPQLLPWAAGHWTCAPQCPFRKSTMHYNSSFKIMKLTLCQLRNILICNILKMNVTRKSNTCYKSFKPDMETN
jgi:hypothetical protein